MPDSVTEIASSVKTVLARERKWIGGHEHDQIPIRPFLTELAALLEWGLLPYPFVTVFVDGVTIDPAQFLAPQRVMGRDIRNIVGRDEILTLVGEGATVMLNRAELYLPVCHQMAVQLAEIVEHDCMTTTVLISGGGVSGLRSHTDSFDVGCVYRVLGNKKWEIGEEGSMEYLSLLPGDWLILSGETIHRASAPELSIHFVVQSRDSCPPLRERLSPDHFVRQWI